MLQAQSAVLEQEDTNGDRHPCAFLSQTMNSAEQKYQVYDRELLSILRALRAWQHYIQGSSSPVTIFSDHLNLTYYRKPQRLSGRQA